MALNLRKAEQSVLNLKKSQGIENQEAEIAFVCDYSGSMSAMYDEQYYGGERQECAMQKALNRILPVGMAFSKSKSVDTWFFHGGHFKAKEPLNEETLEGYVKRNTKGQSLGSTSYAPVVNAIADEYRRKYGYEKRMTEVVTKEPLNWFLAIIYFIFGIKRKTTIRKVRIDVKIDGTPADGPLLVFFSTDGGNDDQHAFIKALEDCAGLPIFWQLISYDDNGGNFRNLEEADTITTRYIDNANYFNFSLREFNTLSDDELNARILNEFGNTYIPLAKSPQYKLIA